MVAVGIHGDVCSSLDGWFPWKPTWLPQRNDLYCDFTCADKLTLAQFNIGGNISELDNCCKCRSCTTMSDQVIDLDLEHISITGKSLVLSGQPFDNSSFYQIHYTNGFLTAIPSNLCNWDSEVLYFESDIRDHESFWKNIVTLRFDYNNIRDLPDLNCLQRLDTLSMLHNNLMYLTNTSISNLTYLRVLDLSGNNIKSMDPGILTSPHLHVLHADFSSNNIALLEVTNLCIMQPFCRIEYNDNKITDLINTVGFSFSNTHSGPGMVSLTNNLIEVFPDIKTLLGLDNLTQFGKFANWGFDLRGIKLDCNCNLAPFVTLGEKLANAIWQDYFDVKCVSPSNLKGQTAFDVDAELLVCDRTDNCFHNCTCVDQPSLDTLNVTCINKGFRDLPETVPNSEFSQNIVLNVSRNFITRPSIVNRTYLRNVSAIDMSSNILEHFDSDMAEMLEHATIDISNNLRLRRIPQLFQFRNICEINMHSVILDCDCENVWIETWISTKSSNSCKPQFTCDVPGKGLMAATEFKKSLISCKTDNTDNKLFILIGVITALILVLTLIALLVNHFKYEIIVAWTLINQTSLKKHVASFQHDVIISLNEEDEHLRHWVKDTLLPDLNIKGYRVFLPNRDIMFGSERDREMSETVARSRTFLLVLSESYLTTPEDSTQGRSWTENEWKYGWNNFLEHPDHNLVIVNYDYVETSVVNHDQIRAFLRVGHVVDFDNYEEKVLSKITKKIGTAALNTMNVVRADTNSKVRFKLGLNQMLDEQDSEQKSRKGKFPNAATPTATPNIGRNIVASIAPHKESRFSRKLDTIASNEKITVSKTGRPQGAAALVGRFSKVAPLDQRESALRHISHRHHACFH